MGFSRQEYWSGLGALLQGIFPTLGSIPSSPTFQVDSSSAEPQGKPTITIWPSNSTPEYISKRIKIGIQEVLIVNVHCSIIHNSQEMKTTHVSISIESEGEATQSSQTLSDPKDYCLPASSVHGIPRQEYQSGLPLPSQSACEWINTMWYIDTIESFSAIKNNEVLLQATM